MANQNNTSTKVITGRQTRISYANLFEPKGFDGSKPVYSASLIIPKDDTRTLELIRSAIEAAYQNGLYKLRGAGKALPTLNDINTPLNDGDKKRPNDPAYANSYYINAKNADQPKLFDADRNPIIDRSEIYSGINDMFDRHFSRNTLSSILGIITSSLRYAKRQGWIRENAADDIDLPSIRQSKTLRHKERNAITRESIERIFVRFPEGSTAHLPMMLAYHCGLRLGETFGLTWNDVDLTRGFLTINQQIQYFTDQGCWRLVPPKYDSVRQIRLDDEIWALLKRAHRAQMEQRLHYGHNYIQPYIDRENYLNYDGHGDMIWMVNTYEDGRFVQPGITQHSNRVIHRELGMPDFDFHSLRHTHATELSEAGVNLKEIQRRLGHKSLEITNRRYIHATDIMEQQSIDIMNEMYKNKGVPQRSAMGMPMFGGYRRL